MFSPRISRLHAVIILALAVVVWSNAAVASFVCPHMSGCEHGMPAPGDANAGTENADVETMPCCPMNSDNASIECNASAMECCAWHRDSDVSAVLFASDQPRPRQIAAVLSAAAVFTPRLIARAHVPGLADVLTHVKPVTQKKTDLRI